MTGRLLLDTHVWIWNILEPARFSAKVRRRLEGADSLWVSSVSAWELALLVERGRIDLDRPVSAWIDEAG